MLKLFKDIFPFFEDAYQEYSMTSYATKIGVSIPTARTTLLRYEKDGLLRSEKQFNAIVFRIYKSDTYTKLLHLYWFLKITESGLLDEIENCYFTNKIILFGSIQKGEQTINSDIDIAVVGDKIKDIDTAPFEKKLKREIQIIEWDNKKSKKIPLYQNIKKGYRLRG